MARKLAAGVVLRHPGSGVVTFLPAGSELPDWAAGLVGDHALERGQSRSPQPEPIPATEPADVPAPAPAAVPTSPGPPPKSGRGSSDAAWTDYARSHGVPVTDEMKRSEVIAACEAAGVPTE